MGAAFLVLLALACPLGCVAMAVAAGIGARRAARRKSAEAPDAINKGGGDSEETPARVG